MTTAFVILGAGRPFSGEQHTALRSAGSGARVLDWTLHAVASRAPDHYFVCGYQAEAIKASYPEFHYFHNPDWESTRAGWSLLHALPLNATDYIVCYSDILFRRAAIRKLMEFDGDIAVAVDRQWRTRYSGRQSEDLDRCEKVCVADDTVTRLGTGIPTSQASAEFIGLVRFSARAVERLLDLRVSSSVDETHLRRTSVPDLLELLRIQGIPIAAVDVRGDWAELNESADLARFVLGTKAQTLSRLKRMITRSRIEEQISFTVEQWESSPLHWINTIQERFRARNVVVRSSALNEDGFQKSNAGAYISLLNVNSAHGETLHEAIDAVIASYSDGDPANEVLVQPMLCDVMTSGVVFTRSLASGAPYYVANYDDVSGSTESITSGICREHKTLVIRRDADARSPAIPEKLRGLLPALREIEALLGYDSLDIEFALTADHGLHILQVRPIAVDHSSWAGSDEAFYTLLRDAEAAFARWQTASPFVRGRRTLFGVMPDWNPAEIIGTKPSLLATSLYRELIMDETWATQRAEYGYRDVRPQPLLVSFSGHPYVDVRASFNSFVPAELEDDLTERLVDFCLDWLEHHPELHDKVEFDVIPTCFDLDFSRWEKRLSSAAGFDIDEIDQIRQSLKRLTSRTMRRTADIERIGKLESRFQALQASSMAPLEKACALLDDARAYGTLPFAHLARSAFVAVTLLRSAVTTGVLTEQEKEDFFNSIRTVSHDLTRDARACATGALDWEAFVERYGHLRPGTYDVISPSYRQDTERFLRPIVARAAEHDDHAPVAAGSLWRNARQRFVAALAQAGLPAETDAVEDFLRSAIEGREYAKFAFTRNLSLALDELARWSQDHGVSREVLAQVSIADLRALRTGSVVVPDTGDWLRMRADQAEEQQTLVNAMELAPLLCRDEDFSVFQYPATHANYIGSKAVTADCIDLDQYHGENVAIEGLIVLIPQADPGYDWLFGRRIAGLITMYGGANSHMAIRTAEFGLPAAIGVGEIHYRNLASAQEIELNPVNRVIRVLR